MQSSWLITVFSGLPSKIRELESKIPFIFEEVQSAQTIEIRDAKRVLNFKIHLIFRISLLRTK